MNNDVEHICVVNRSDRTKRWYSSVAFQNEAVVYTTAFGANNFYFLFNVTGRSLETSIQAMFKKTFRGKGVSGKYLNIADAALWSF